MLRKFLIIALWTLLSSAPAWADSLYASDEDDSHRIGLYGVHPMELEVGDIIKVKIQEKTNADVELGVDSKDSYKSSTGITRSAEKLLGRVLTPVFDLLGQGDFEFDTSSQFKDDGSTDRSSRLDALVTVLVVDELESGNYIIEGRKQINVNNETQTMVVRGLIDPRDVSSERIVESDSIADVEISYLGEGALSKKQKPGFLSRVIDFIF